MCTYTDWRPNLLHGVSTAVFVGSRTVDSLLSPAIVLKRNSEKEKPFAIRRAHTHSHSFNELLVSSPAFSLCSIKIHSECPEASRFQPQTPRFPTKPPPALNGLQRAPRSCSLTRSFRPRLSSGTSPKIALERAIPAKHATSTNPEL